jgi:hypothetical protein
MSDKFRESFPKDYRDFTIARNLRETSKKFNLNIERFKYVLVYPFDKKNKENGNNHTLIVAFSNDPKVFEYTKGAPQAAYKDFHIVDTITVTDLSFEFLVFETSIFEPISLEKVEWSKLINAPKIDDGDFSDLQTAFLSFFGLDENEYNQDYSDSFNFSRFFCHEENKPYDLELRVVWRDVDSGDKYGNIVTLIFWKNDFIGWVTHSGKWLDSEDVNTVDIEKFKDLMQFIYDKTGFIRSNRLHGISIYDMDKHEVDDLVSVPGVSMRNYSEED